MVDREAPRSVEAEMSLLGSMILDPRVINDVREVVSHEHFYDERHATIFRALCDAHAANPSLDLVQLNEVLRDRGVLERVGGGAYLVKLAESVPAAVNAPHYAKIVADKHVARSVITILQAAEDATFRAREPSRVVEAATKAASALADIVLRSSQSGSVTMREVLAEVYRQIESKTTAYHKTGVEPLDELTGGVPVAGVVITLGINGSGKSSLVNQIGVHLASLGVPGRVHSYEMGERAAVAMGAAASDVKMFEIIREAIQPTDEQWKKLLTLQGSDTAANIHFSTRSMTASQIYAQAAADASRGHKWVIVDYIQNVAAEPGQDNEAASIADTARTLQRIAREFKMLVLAVSQMTANSKREAKRPQASDVVGSGAIFDVADMMLGTYRPCLFVKDPSEVEDWDAMKREAEIIVLKNKYGGLGICPVEYKPGLFKFVAPVRGRWM